MNSEKIINISEIFLSIQGEGTYAGWPCFFIRFAGCDIRCSWCDTKYSWHGGKELSYDEILNSIPDWVPFIQITGGEPLMQAESAVGLMHDIHRKHKAKILLETGGHRDISSVPDFVHINMDIKLGSSGEYNEYFINNIKYLKRSDEVKFVTANEADFFQAIDLIKKYSLGNICRIIFSPVMNETVPDESGFTPARLAQLLLENRMQAAMQLQLHKYIWPGVRGV